MADLDTFLQEYADWANAKPDDDLIAQVRLALNLPFLTKLSSAHHLLFCVARWGARKRFDGYEGIYDNSENQIGDLSVAISPPATATISNHPITVGSIIGFKLRIYQPNWERSLVFKPNECHPPNIVGWVDIEGERQPCMIRFEHREYRPRST